MDNFDLSLYFPLPNLTTDGCVTLGNVLLAHTPKMAPAHIESAVKLLAQSVAEAEAGLVERIDEELTTGSHKAFRHFVGGAWCLLRDRFREYELYAHSGAAELSDADRVALNWDERIERARVAGRMRRRLFGGGLGFLRLPYPQQAVQMDARLTWLKRDHGVPLDALVGPDVLPLLERCQLRFEAMVSDRGSRTGRSTTDLTQIRLRLRRQISSYCGAVGTMADGANPASFLVVEAALRPILIARANAHRKPGETEFDADKEFEDIADDFDEQSDGDEESDQDPEQDKPAQPQPDKDDQDEQPTE